MRNEKDFLRSFLRRESAAESVWPFLGWENGRNYLSVFRGLKSFWPIFLGGPSRKPVSNEGAS